MRNPLATFVCVCALLGPVAGQAPAPDAAERLPVSRVVLYKTGVGYFEHLGTIRGTQDVSIRFTSAQLNDVVKSLTALDLGGGRITGISYNSVAPLDQRLDALRIPLGRDTSLVQVLMALRGTRVEATTPGGSATGRLLTVERRTRRVDGATVEEHTFSVVTDAGEVRTFELGPLTRVRLAEPDMRQELGRYLNLVGSAREQDVRRLVIGTDGRAERRLFVSYISEVPIWKTTYRLVLPEKGATTGPRAPFIQGWAVVDNTIGEDWDGVELSLVAGAPQSFIQQISQPYYAQRPVVPLPSTVLLSPQTHAPTLQAGAGRVAGVVNDGSGAALPGTEVTVRGAAGDVQATSDAGGRYDLTVPPGVYVVTFRLPGFGTRTVDHVRVDAGTETVVNARLDVSGVREEVAVGAERPAAPAQPGRNRGVGGGVARGGGTGIGRYSPQAESPRSLAPGAAAEYMREQQAAAAAADLADLFEYRVKTPVTILKNQSALVPILNADIAAEKVSLWSAAAGSNRPMRAVWITNTTGLTLDGGSLTVIESSAFAGEGLVEPLKPAERRLISYAADLGVRVSPTDRTLSSRTVRVRSHEGFLLVDRQQRREQTYRVRNEDGAARAVIVEHPIEGGWKLAEGQRPEESTAFAHRFRVEAGARSEATLSVRETHAGESRLSIAEVTDEEIVALAATGVSADDLRRELAPVLAKRRELSDVQRRREALEHERERIAMDQHRLRENMKALRGSAEERLLLQRYTRLLDAQETRLDALREESERLAADHDRIAVEMLRLAAEMAFDLTADRLSPPRQ